jgi:hypothetical protein
MVGGCNGNAKLAVLRKRRRALKKRIRQLQKRLRQVEAKIDQLLEKPVPIPMTEPDFPVSNGGLTMEDSVGDGPGSGELL